ncbi:armadillo-type protein [Phlyctochytrium arcticum]|nr:armadillo-type protein [Phlyctochytrium arcticum]
MAQTIASDALNPEVLSQLAEVLAQLASPDNNVRSAAEDKLNTQLAGQPDLLLSAMANVTRQHPDVHLRSFSAILLRRLALKQAAAAPKNQAVTYFVWIGDGPRTYIQNELLESIKSEQHAQVRRKVADTVAELAKHMLRKGSTWSELLHALFECARSPAADHRISAFQIIAQVPGLIADIDVQSMKRSFGAALQDTDSKVRLEALNATIQYMIELEGSGVNQFTDFIPQMLNVLPPLVEEEDELEKGLGYFIELADVHPKSMRAVIPQLVSFTTDVMKNEDIDMSRRQTALELLMTLSEAAPAMMRKHGGFVQTLVPILLQWMANLDEDEKWYTVDDVEDDDPESDDILAGEALDRLARALGGKAVLPVAFTVIPGMLAAPEWQKRHGALMTVSAIGEGCAKIMEAELARVLQLIVPHLRDPHARVQWAACNAIGQMSTDFAPVMQTKYAELVLTHLVPVMDFRDQPRVQAHAAAALVNFCQEMTKDAVAPYLGTIFEKLMVLLSTGKTYVQEQALTTIATVADSAEDNFTQYYAAIMPLLLNVLRSASAKEFRLLRGKAMECASLISLAVGKTTFAPNAVELIDLLRQSQESITDADDPQSSYLLAAWARVCKVLEADFVPYLPYVLPPLLHSAQLKPDYALIDSEEDEETVRDKYDDDWEMLVIDGQRIGIRTTVLEEKCTAVEMLICYARELGAGFAPYVKQVMAIVVPLLKFYFHEGVRHAAGATIPLLFSSAVKAQLPREEFDIFAAWHEVCAKIIETSKDESDLAFLAQLYTTMSECLDVLGAYSTPENLRDDFVTATTAQLEEYFGRITEREASRKDVDHDQEDEEVLQTEEEHEDMFLAELSTALHQFLKHHREAFIPQFDRFAPYVQRFITSSQFAARQWAICVFDDVLEFTGPQSLRYRDAFWAPMVQGLSDSAAEVRQAAAYGAGVAAKYGGVEYAQPCAQALPSLFAMIDAPDARSEENILATENAVAAIGKICHFLGHTGAFDLNDTLVRWVKALPVVEDSDEAPHTYAYLLELLTQNHPAILGPSNAHIPHICLALAQILSRPDVLAAQPATSTIPSALDPPEYYANLTPRLSTALQQLLALVDPAVKQGLWNALAPEQQKVLVTKGFV